MFQQTDMGQVARNLGGELNAMGAGLGYSQASTGLSNSIFDSLLTDLAEATAVARDIRSTMHDTRARLFGPWPEKGSEGSAGIETTPASIEAQIGTALSQLRAVLLAAREHSSVVANRL